MTEVTITSYACRRALFLNGEHVPQNELVPEAKRFFRLDNLLHTGHLKEVKVSEGELLAAIEKRCPERLDELVQAYALDDHVYPQGPRGVPTMRPGKSKLAGNIQRAERKAPVKIAKPAAKKAPAKKAPAKKA